MAAASTYTSPCAACKFLRRKCLLGCVFAPYFPADEPQKFANVHKIFGASNVSKLLNELAPHQRDDAVHSLAYEAEARVRDPVYGCVGAISFLQAQVQRLEQELDAANADLFRYACNDRIASALPNDEFHRRSGNEGIRCSQSSGFFLSYSIPGNVNDNRDANGKGEGNI